VIASNVNGVSELIHHRKTGYLLDSLNIDIICNAIKFAVENHGCEEIQSWGVAAREHIARNFTLPQMLDQLESYFYSQINFEFR
jgi:glycosyltransferase involved in cell wall biosynthesis